MTSTKPKFLVLYPDPSNLNDVFRKINIQNSKIGPFSAVILLGSLNCQSVELAPDVPTYYMKSDEGAENFFENNNSNNLIGVNAPSIIKVHCGITVAFVNTHVKGEVAMTPGFEGKVDLMFSFHWPQVIAASHNLILVANRYLDDIIKSLKPRYHFAVGSDTGRYLENQPFAWTKERACRFISLGREKSGSKWFYAFSLGLEADDVSDSGPNPFTFDLKQKAIKPIIEQNEDSTNQLAIEKLKRNREENDHDKPSFKKRVTVSPESCFFCLSNPKVETHMIVAIGKYSYLTIAKGPLTTPTKDLGIAGHAILIPIEHTPTGLLPQETREELTKFQEATASAFAKKDYGVVFFEISRPENVHFHIQMVPIPKKLISQFRRALENRTEVNNERFLNNEKLNFVRLSASDSNTDTTQESYVRFSIFEDLKLLCSYLSHISGNNSVDLQFPRRVLAYLLKVPKRQSWDRCRQSIADETDECQKFKTFFESFNFTKSE